MPDSAFCAAALRRQRSLAKHFLDFRCRQMREPRKVVLGPARMDQFVEFGLDRHAIAILAVRNVTMVVPVLMMSCQVSDSG